MNLPTSIRRIGWFAALSLCLAMYTLLHLKVNAVHSDVVRAEREIVRLQSRNLLLETEFLTRANQMQLARWNRVEFGLSAPQAEQFIPSERQLAQFSGPRGDGAPAPIRLAGMTVEADAPAYPQLVSPLTGEPVAQDLAPEAPEGGRLTVVLAPDRVRVPLATRAVATGTRAEPR